MSINYKFVLAFILIIFFSFIACEKYDDIAPYAEYKIKAGKHESTGRFINTLETNFLTYEVIFDESAKYTINKTDQADINKLFGFSGCNSEHHENSARFGWRWYNDSLQIFAYYYNNSVRYDHFLTSVELNKSYRYTLALDNDHYIFNIDNLVYDYKVPRTKKCDSGVYYLLYPYFGGNVTAPQDIYIYMKRHF